MKCKLLSVSLALAWPLFAGAASDFYVNDSVVNCPPQVPPQVDATNFVNNNYFSVNFTNAIVNPLYRTANTLNFTNSGWMFANYGFQFDTGPSGSGQRKMASSFENSGIITAGSISNANPFFNFFFNGFILQTSLPKLIISATNVNLNSGTTAVGLNGLFSLTGKNVDMDRASILMEGFDDNAVISNTLFFATTGVFDSYWGVGTNNMIPGAQFQAGTPQTPAHLVTSVAANNFYQQFFQILSLPAAVPYVNEGLIGTNRFVQAVFLSDTNDAILNNVYFPFLGRTVVEWLTPQTNSATGEVSTNYVYLVDDFGLFGTNGLVQNTFQALAQPTFIPLNYTFLRGGPFAFGLAAAPGLPAGTFNNVIVTNEFAAYGVRLSPTTRIPGYTVGSVITNLPGRTEIDADNLNLSHANISGLNYLRLHATNHVHSTDQARVTVPYSDISLRSTNGNLAITNLLSPTVPRYTGDVNLWSGRWTNDVAGVPTIFHVLFVDSRLSPTAQAQIQDLTLRSTNAAGGGGHLAISDVLNVSRSLMLEAEQITITTNAPGAVSPSGEINFWSTSITWPGSTPRLAYLTNAGRIFSSNSVFFGGSRTAPHYTSNYNEPYIAFVNRGTITTEGSLIWANYFENSGLFNTGLNFGSVNLESQNTLLTNGSFLALNGDITITTSSLVVSNHSFQAGRKLTLAVSNSIADLAVGPVVSNANNWVVGRGFNLPVKPPVGDLAGTIITETAAPGIDNPHVWAAHDLGGTNSLGFQNNVALGKVILDARSAASKFSFIGANSNNAIYIDYLELRNFATNISLAGNLTALGIGTNIVVYYAQAVANGISVAERLNHANGDRLRWAFNHHVGFYSSTNLVYPDGSTNSFNAALVLSQNLDSDNDGIVNAVDPTPILRDQDIAMTVSMITQPALAAEVSWRTLPGSENTVYYRTSAAAANWQVLTNFTASPFVGERISVTDPIVPGGGRYYRVKMTPPQP